MPMRRGDRSGPSTSLNPRRGSVHRYSNRSDRFDTPSPIYDYYPYLRDQHGGSRLHCPSCAHENPDTAKFCSECAAPLLRQAQCTACGSSNAPGSKFCNECAQPLTATTSGAAATHTPTPITALPSSFAAGRYTVKGFLGEGGRK